MHALRKCFVALHVKDGCCLFRDLPNHPLAVTAWHGMAWKEKASPGGRGTECEHGLAHPITAQNQVLGTAARRYIPAWGHAVLPEEEEEEGGQEGWLASAGSSRSRRLAHDMLDAGAA